MNGQSVAVFVATNLTPMAAVSFPGGASGVSEARTVALVSRAAAVALAAVVIALFSLFEIETPAEGLGAPVVNAFLSAPPSRPPPPRVVWPQAPTAVSEATSAVVGKAEDWPHLWTYDAQGRIVLRTDEQLMRCMNARQQGREESDCPDSGERTPMVSRES